MDETYPTIIVPDTHGHCAYVEALLRYLTKQGWLQDHRLVFLGDYLDRGRQVRELIELCINLQAQGHVFLSGNHEYTLSQLWLTRGQTRQAWIRRWAHNYEQGTLASYGWRHTGRKVASVQERARAITELVPARHRQWLASLPLVYENASQIMVHAGLFPDQSWSDQRQVLASFRSEHQTDTRGPSQLFSVALAESLKNPSHKQLVTGHVVYPRPWVSRKRVQLNCGVETGGPLVVLISDTNQLVNIQPRSKVLS